MEISKGEKDIMYNLFISHSWKHNNEYNNLIGLLSNYYYFSFKNYSVPKSDSLDISGSNYKRKLRMAIINQMKTAHVVLVIAGVYASYSDSIQMEIEIAQEMNKPIIAINPWGSSTTSQIVKNAATITVGWNSASIVSAIRKYSI